MHYDAIHLFLKRGPDLNMEKWHDFCIFCQCIVSPFLTVVMILSVDRFND
jgi:hypothetical protein